MSDLAPFLWIGIAIALLQASGLVAMKLESLRSLAKQWKLLAGRSSVAEAGGHQCKMGRLVATILKDIAVGCIM